MRALVVYESVYGNTHHVAQAIADGLRDHYTEVEALSTDEATDAQVRGVDLLVVGGPTHGHMMATTQSKQGAVDAEHQKEAKGEPSHDLDEHALSESLRAWFKHLEHEHHARAAAFDTRIDMAPAITGRASKGIGRRLRHHGWDLVVEPESFLVDKENALLSGELERATDWGRTVASKVDA